MFVFQMTRLKEESSKLQSQLDEKEANEGAGEVESLKKKLSEVERLHESAVEELNEEISALQFQLSSEMLTADSEKTPAGPRGGLDEEETELRSRVSDQDMVIEQLEKELETALQGGTASPSS